MSGIASVRSLATPMLAGIVGCIVCASGLAVAIGGWKFEIRWLAAPVPGASSMKINTAVCIGLIGASIAILGLTKLRWIATCLGVVVIAGGGFSLVEHATRSTATWFDLALSNVTFGESAEYINRMGINTAFCFVLMGVAIVLISRKWLVTFAQVLALVVSLITYVALLGYVMNVGFLIQPNAVWTQMAPHTSVLLFLSTLAIFALNPDSGIMSEINDDHAGGRQARFMIPVVFVASIAMGVSVRVMANIGLQQPIPAQLVVGMFTIALLPIIWVAAFLNNKIDRQRQQNEAISLAVESAPDGVLVVDSVGVVTLANAKAATLIKLSAPEIVGRNVDEFVPDALRADHMELRKRFTDHPSSRPMGSGMSIELQSADGTVTPVDISLSPVDIGGPTRHVFVSIRDRSELVRANRDLQQFAYVASHDLRAPLRTVSGFADLLRFSLEERELTEDEADAFAEIAGGIDKMNALIGALLDYSRLGRESAEPKPRLIADEVADVLTLVRSDIESSDVTIQSNLPAGLTWNVDDALMRSAVLNVVSNSIRYRRPEVDSVIEFSASKPRFGGTQLTVKDNGQGISVEHLDRSTEMFQRLTTTGDGLGIGLAMVKRIVEVHDGRIVIDSDGHTYTSVTIWVPA